MKPLVVLCCTEICSLIMNMHATCLLFNVSLTGGSLAGLDVGAMGYMLMLAALLTHLERIECVKSASHFVLRMSIIFYLIAQHILTLGTIMPPFFTAFKQFLLSSTVVILVYWDVTLGNALNIESLY